MVDPYSLSAPLDSGPRRNHELQAFVKINSEVLQCCREVSFVCILPMGFQTKGVGDD